LTRILEKYLLRIVRIVVDGVRQRREFEVELILRVGKREAVMERRRVDVILSLEKNEIDGMMTENGEGTMIETDGGMTIDGGMMIEIDGKKSTLTTTAIDETDAVTLVEIQNEEIVSTIQIESLNEKILSMN